jgi:hypothetical protein
MLRELQNGPIVCGIACSPEFNYNYSSGIMEDTTNFLDVDHDVEVVGWGEEEGKKFWMVRHSWGTYWGINGFFKIVRGSNNLGIESDCHYMVPEVSDEELVWNEKRPAAYGGSHWGIKPFDEARAADHKVISTSDVTGNNLQLKTHELSPSNTAGVANVAAAEAAAAPTQEEETVQQQEEEAPVQLETESSSTHSYLSSVGLVAVGMGVGVGVAKYSARREYQAL